LHRAKWFRATMLRTAFVALGAGLLCVLGLMAVPASASAAATSVSGTIHRTFQNRDGSLWVAGYVYDRNNPRRHPAVCITIQGRCARVVRATLKSPVFDRQHHTRGAHRFAVQLGRRAQGVTVVLRTTGRNPVRLARAVALTPGTRVVHVARRYVGSRYNYGGSSPRTGFDCSGYTMFSYRNGQAARLPHNAEAQRRSRGMRRIARSNARPGDLVFYMSGGSAYHVAIYAGHGYQYSATDPQEGVRYQRIYSRNVVFGSDWHR
jgi:cell wall-associated NlpC family hydrolase